MDTLTLLRFIGKCFANPKILETLLKIFEIITTDRYKSLLSEDPELRLLIEVLEGQLLST